MRFALRHRTTYRYNRSIFLEPQTFRLRPQQNAHRQLVRYGLSIEPEPAGLTWLEDPEGNQVAQAWFNGVTDRLSVLSTAVVDVSPIFPFDYLLQPASAQTLPLEYPAPLARRLKRGQSGAIDPAAADFAREMVQQTGGGTIDTLLALCRHLAVELQHEIRDIGPPRPPAETLRLGRGACRDLSQLMIEACRSLGLAARFVSGYQCDVAPGERQHLHAWMEVYLPGAGWRAFDPTQGLAVTDQHLPIAAAHQPIDAAPIVGSYRGTEVEALFDFSLRVRPLKG